MSPDLFEVASVNNQSQQPVIGAATTGTLVYVIDAMLEKPVAIWPMMLYRQAFGWTICQLGVWCAGAGAGPQQSAARII